MGDVQLVLGMGFTCDSMKETAIITQDNNTKSLFELYGMTICDPAYTPAVRIVLSLDQLEGKVLNKKSKQRFQALTGSVLYFG